MSKRIFALFLALFVFSFSPNIFEPQDLVCGSPPPRKTFLPIVQAKEDNMASDSLWWIVVPETTTNLVTNPSVEKATTGYSAIGGSTVLRSSAYTRRGVYSLRVVPTAALNDGAKYSVTLAAATWYTFSLDIKGIDGVSYRLDMWDTVAGVALSAPVDFVSDGGWARYAVTAQTGANTAIELRVYKNDSASGAGFYLDGLQVEAKQYATDYCDGDQDGCLWTAGKHTSASSRQSQFSGAGRMVALDDYDYQVGPVVGAGMSIVDVTVKRPALQDGAVFRKQNIRERTMQIPGIVNQADMIDYHSTRATILRLLNPNRFATQQPVHLRYTGSGKTLDAAFYYRAGFESTCMGCPNENIPLQMYATNPNWQEGARTFTAADIANGIGTGASGTNGSAGENGGGGGNGSLAATSFETIAGVNYIIQKDSAGNWDKMADGLTMPAVPAGPDSRVNVMAIAGDGKIYIGGNFTNVGGGGASYVAMWQDGVGWSPLGAGVDAEVEALAVGSDGMLYVGGGFANAGGAPAAFIAMWDGANWSTFGAGADNTVNDFAVYGTDVYIGGSFTVIGGNAINYVAKWDGVSLTALAGGPPNLSSALAIAPDGTLYSGGAQIGPSYISEWDGAAWTDIGQPNNSATQIGDMIVANNGDLYVVGGFTTMSAVSAVRVAKWNGSVWTGLSTGANAYVNTVALASGKVIIGGGFTVVGGVAANRIASWDGSTWEPFPTEPDNDVNAIITSTKGKLFVGGAFLNVGALAVDYLAVWNNVTWDDYLGSYVNDTIQGQDGKIYVGGGFTDADSVANTAKIAYWDPNLSTWNAMGTGADDGVVFSLAEMANGDIVAGGNFSGMGGVANTQGVAVWDISAGVWTSIGNVNGTPLDIAVAPNGDVYIGGIFYDAGSVAGTMDLAYYDVSAAAWKALSAEPSGPVNSLKFNPAGNLYIGGTFIKIGATTYDYIALYNPTTDTFSALENGTNGYVNAIDIAPNGCVYLAGTFTQAGVITGANYVAAWNGSQFQVLGDGLNNVGYALKSDANGLIYVGGSFTTAGGMTLPDKVAVWNGTNWKPIDVDLPGLAAVEVILFAPTITILGFDTSGTATAAYVN